jgi:hypothetical protein
MARRFPFWTVNGVTDATSSSHDVCSLWELEVELPRIMMSVFEHHVNALSESRQDASWVIVAFPGLAPTECQRTTDWMSVTVTCATYPVSICSATQIVVLLVVLASTKWRVFAAPNGSLIVVAGVGGGVVVVFMAVVLF